MTRRALAWTLAVLFIGSLSGTSAWHFTRAIRDITIVAVHVEIDEKLSRNGTAELWLGRERLPGRKARFLLSGRSRHPFEITNDLDLVSVDSLDRTIAAGAVLPGVIVEERAGGRLPFVDVLLLSGEHPARAFRGFGSLEGERHPWLWVLVSEPEEPMCGLALRARHGGVDLIDRDVVLEGGTIEPHPWRRTLTRLNVTKRIISIRFGAPRPESR